VRLWTPNFIRVKGLYGGFGDDRVEGNGGEDLIVGGAGGDLLLLLGGFGDDRIGDPVRGSSTVSFAGPASTSWRPAREISWPPTARG
jgi:Ca2+-binding RTX toxin-like protein